MGRISISICVIVFAYSAIQDWKLLSRHESRVWHSIAAHTGWQPRDLPLNLSLCKVTHVMFHVVRCQEDRWLRYDIGWANDFKRKRRTVVFHHFFLILNLGSTLLVLTRHISATSQGRLTWVYPPRSHSEVPSSTRLTSYVSTMISAVYHVLANYVLPIWKW